MTVRDRYIEKNGRRIEEERRRGEGENESEIDARDTHAESAAAPQG